MATVITNLLSAIPIFGPDLVELIWGGFLSEEPGNSNIIFKIPLYAETFLFINSSLLLAPINLFLLNFPREIQRLNYNVKQIKSADKYSQIANISQRLNVEDPIYAYFVGLIEGDGWFSVSKKGKYLMYELGIELHLRDKILIETMKDLLGAGIIKYRETDHRSKTVTLSIRSKTDLLEKIIPIFDRYPMLTSKKYDYFRFKDALIKNIKFSDLLPYYSRDIASMEDKSTVESILNSTHFSAWLIGFIESEGSFSTYKPTGRNNLEASFNLAQTNGKLIITAISKYLNFTQSINTNNKNSYSIKVASVQSILNVIFFMQNAPVKLLGYKKIQYINWLNEIRKIPKFNSTVSTIPDDY